MKSKTLSERHLKRPQGELEATRTPGGTRLRPQESVAQLETEGKGTWTRPTVTWTVLLLSGRKSGSKGPETVFGTTVYGAGLHVVLERNVSKRPNLRTDV